LDLSCLNSPLGNFNASTNPNVPILPKIWLIRIARNLSAGDSIMQTRQPGVWRSWRKTRRSLTCLVGLLGLSASLCGCTTLAEYFDNGCKVGPNYDQPAAPVAKEWIDAGDRRVRSDTADLDEWWSVFNDPVLNDLIETASKENLTLRQAGFRILEARAQLAISKGELFPQAQFAKADYTRNAFSIATANGTVTSPLGSVALNQFYSQWDFGFGLGWELDFWGRFRRAVESDSASLDASVANYDDVLVTLLGDVATNYVDYRTLEMRIKYANDNVDLQRETLKIADARFVAGTVNEVDVDQAKSTLAQTEAGIPALEISLRQTNNRLCILLGMHPADLKAKLGSGAIPTAPPEAAVGSPADLLRRRPDVRRAERQAAAQCAQIGVAESEFYPHIAIVGDVGYSADQFKELLRSTSFAGQIGPSFQWNILNYGRIVNNERLQDAKFQELIAAYQNTVLSANEDVENGLVTYLKSQQRAKTQAESVANAEKAVNITKVLYKTGNVDLTRVTLLQQTLVEQQDTLALAQGDIATGLIHVYRALGGGWKIPFGKTERRPPNHSPYSDDMASAGSPEPPPSPLKPNQK
jgi:NodT family efflux transporter outer membrane factor (OMF) lipoprotein